MTKYIEIFKLKKMLEEAGIPFEFYDRSDSNFEGYQIRYPNTEQAKCSIIQSDRSYGGEENLLEMKGLLTKEEKRQDSVAGFLMAEEVFRRIKEDWGRNSNAEN